MTDKYVAITHSPEHWHSDPECGVVTGEMRPATEADLRRSITQCTHCKGGKRPSDVLAELGKAND